MELICARFMIQFVCLAPTFCLPIDETKGLLGNLFSVAVQSPSSRSDTKRFRSYWNFRFSWITRWALPSNINHKSLNRLVLSTGYVKYQKMSRLRWRKAAVQGKKATCRVSHHLQRACYLHFTSSSLPLKIRAHYKAELWSARSKRM